MAHWPLAQAAHDDPRLKKMPACAAGANRQKQIEAARARENAFIEQFLSSKNPLNKQHNWDCNEYPE